MRLHVEIQIVFRGQNRVSLPPIQERQRHHRTRTASDIAVERAALPRRTDLRLVDLNLDFLSIQTGQGQLRNLRAGQTISLDDGRDRFLERDELSAENFSVLIQHPLHFEFIVRPLADGVGVLAIRKRRLNGQVCLRHEQPAGGSGGKNFRAVGGSLRSNLGHVRLRLNQRGWLKLGRRRGAQGQKNSHPDRAHQHEQRGEFVSFL